MANIFLSYTVRDGAVDSWKLRAIYKQLSHSGNVFVDLLHNRGTNRRAAWLANLMKSELIVLYWSPGVLTSPWVIQELSFGLCTGIPVVVMDQRSGRDSERVLNEVAGY